MDVKALQKPWKLQITKLTKMHENNDDEESNSKHNNKPKANSGCVNNDWMDYEMHNELYLTMKTLTW